MRFRGWVMAGSALMMMQPGMAAAGKLSPAEQCTQARADVMEHLAALKEIKPDCAYVLTVGVEDVFSLKCMDFRHPKAGELMSRLGRLASARERVRGCKVAEAKPLPKLEPLMTEAEPDEVEELAPAGIGSR